jgi:hypothetical protein
VNSLLRHAPHGVEDLRQALWRIGSATPAQAAASVLLLGVFALAGWLTQSFNWLMLFAALASAIAVACACFLFSSMVLPPRAGWSWTWLLLPLSIAAGAGFAVVVFRLGVPYLSLKLLDNARVFGSAAVVVALVIGLPVLAAQRQARALHLANLERAALAAQLKSLQAQVEPHFLYNTLANTRYLARHQPEKAVLMLDHLIAYLRAALPDMRTDDSTVGRECELATHYLSLMAIRFGDRLTTVIECPEELRSAAMPPLMLMSLVENAVQHGVEPQPGEVQIHIAVRGSGDVLRILVADNGAGLGQVTLGSGIGLRNVRERLAAQYGSRASVELRVNSRGDTEAELRLPLTMERHD